MKLGDAARRMEDGLGCRREDSNARARCGVRRPFDPETDEIYDAWIDPEKHGALTDSTVISDEDGTVGSSYTASDEYIHATFTEQEPGACIVQSWRSTEFSEDAVDSIIEVILTPVASGAKVTINHSDIPEGQGKDYRNMRA